MARLQFQLKVDGLEDESLVVRGFEGQESLSDSVWRSEPCYGFRYQVDLASALSNLTAEQFVDQTAHLTILRDGQVVQQINGIVRQLSKGDTGHRHTFYSLTLVPALERLSLRSNSRIFQQQSVPEVISILLQEMGIEDYAFALKRECAQREFCVQYRETDLQFLHRIAAEEGLVYSHLHEAQKHTLLFTDSSDSQPKLAKPVPYNALAGGEINLPYVVDLQFKTTAQVSHTELKDYSFKKPAYGFTQRTQGKDIAYQQPNYEHFDAPGRYKDDANGKAFSQIRLEYLRRDALLADAKSDEPLLLAGVRFDLQDHLDHAMNRDWLVVQANHQGTQPQALQEEGGSGATTYSNQLKLIPAHITWRARPCAKPQVDGPMIATVVGPQGEEIYCDNFGRVKVHFPWDRYSSSNEKSSCWVRVAQEWAGSQYGSMAIPRVGHEVIVSFLNGDPDQPIVTGRTYHATNTAPYALPDHKTKTVLRTETHQGQGYNELSFEDQAGSEQILLHAQKDWDALIEHDHTEVIRHDQHLTVDNDRFTRIQRNQHLTVEGEVRSKIALDSSHEVGASLQHKVGQRIAVEAGKEISLKSGAKIVVEAGAELTLKAGGSFVKIDAGGVHLVGPAINLNAGGSAGSGSAYGGQLAAAPRMLAQAKPVAELVQPDIAASIQSGAARVIDVASLPTMMPSSANNTANDEPVAEEKTPERILKSDLLKPSDELEKLAKRQASAYRQGNHSDEVKLLQEALIKLGFDLGKAGADGDFGSKTKTAIEQFQKSYQPSHQTNPYYSIGAVDGIVGKGTLLALDEALMDGWVYENIDGYIYSQDGGFLGKTFNPSNVVYIAESKDDSGNYINVKELINITHEEFQISAAIVKHEGTDDKSPDEYIWIAHSANNYATKKGKSLYQILMTSYSSVPKSEKVPLPYSKEDLTSNFARKAVASVYLDPDPTNGATLWDGTDFIAWGLNSPDGTPQNKFEEYYRITIDSSTYKNFLSAQLLKYKGGKVKYYGKYYDIPSMVFKEPKNWASGNFVYDTGYLRRKMILATGTRGRSIFWRVI
ncbi:vgrG protein [Vibrio cholerae]|uniref:type VI secretion system tip protein TssI/VgrG n=1 Tax=Vibrio cholerae TaxID=666 RepID=UPI002084C636|nr:type VI secretion system tip protein TssI/VgrG [Vibrio cholerae]GIB17625.1 vgrG protein [Vibrio cholerae]